MEIRVQFDSSIATWRRQLSVRDAVDHYIEPSAYSYEGRTEQTEETVKNTARFLGKLTAMLVEKGVVTPGELENLLGGNYTVTVE